MKSENVYVKLSAPHRLSIDAAPLERLGAWAGDAALFRKILVDNAARLYDFRQ